MLKNLLNSKIPYRIAWNAELPINEFRNYGTTFSGYIGIKPRLRKAGNTKSEPCAHNIKDLNELLAECQGKRFHMVGGRQMQGARHFTERGQRSQLNCLDLYTLEFPLSTTINLLQLGYDLNQNGF